MLNASVLLSRGTITSLSKVRRVVGIHCQFFMEGTLVHVQNIFSGGGGGWQAVSLWGWRDSYGKTGNFGSVDDKSMLKMYEKSWGRAGG